MDISENIRNLGATLALDPNVPSEVKEIFASAEISIAYTISNHNNAQDFVIPEEALSAPELELSNQ